MQNTVRDFWNGLYLHRIEATIVEQEQAPEHAIQRRALRDARTAELLARERLVKEYKKAYFQAKLDLGVKKARHLFPFVLKKTIAEEEVGEEEPDAPTTLAA